MGPGKASAGEGVIERQSSAAPLPSWARLVVSLSDNLDRVCELCVVIATGVFGVIMLTGVFFRYVLNNSLHWSDEVALIFFVWATFFAIATGYRHDKHVNIGFLVDRLRPAWRAPLSVVSEGLAGAYILCLFVSGLQALDVTAGARTDALQLPLTVPYLCIPVATVLMAVHWMRRNLVNANREAALVKVLIILGFFLTVYLPIGHYIEISGVSRFSLLVLTFAVPLLLGVPVAFSVGLAATMYVGVFGNVSFTTGALQVFFGINIVTLMAIPLLILSGSLMQASGIAQRMVDFAQVLVGRLPGGLGASNVVASFLFGDISGSAVSDTAAIGSLMIPQMKARGYHADFCAALQGASGTLGMTAPLSITLILYATAINASVSRLAAASIVPGLLVAGSFMLVAVVHARHHRYPKEYVPRKLFLPRTLGALPGLSSLVLLMVGILGGVFTPAEVGTVLLTYVLLQAIFLYRAVRPRQLYRLAVEASYVSGMTLFMAATSIFLGFVLARDLVSFLLVETVSQITTEKLGVIFLVSLIFIMLGMVLESPAMIFGFLPSFIPLLTFAHIDLIHWGVLFIINQGLGMLVPPVAMNLFVSTSIAGVRYEQAVRAAIPFMIIMALDMVIVAVFPTVALLIPHLIFDYPLQ